MTGITERGIEECGITRPGIVERGITKPGIVERGIVELGIVERRIVERRIVERRIVEHRIVEHRIVEHRIVEHRIVEHRIVERRIVERRIVEPRVVKSAAMRATPVKPAFAELSCPCRLRLDERNREQQCSQGAASCVADGGWGRNFAWLRHRKNPLSDLLAETSRSSRKVDQGYTALSEIHQNEMLREALDLAQQEKPLREDDRRCPRGARSNLAIQPTAAAAQASGKARDRTPEIKQISVAQRLTEVAECTR